MKGVCAVCGNDTYLQNKKGECGDCVFKKNHKGKSRQEVYAERSKKKSIEIPKPKSPLLSQDGFRQVVQDEESAKNERNQDEAERREKEGEGNIEGLLSYMRETTAVEIKIKHNNTQANENVWGQRSKIYKSKKKLKPIKQVSSKQSTIERAYKLTCIDMDYTTEPVCTGCLRYQGGNIKLSHSHIISRADCKRIGREDLISDRENLTYHCLTFAENTGCHQKWENPIERKTLNDYKKNIAYIKSINEELYLRYTSK